MDDPNSPKRPEEELDVAETQEQSEARPQDEPASVTQADDEAIQTGGDTAKADQIRRDLGVDEPENPDLQKTPEQLFETMLKPKIHEVIEAFGLGPVIMKCKSKLDSLNADETSERKRTRFEKKVVQWLIKPFAKPIFPFMKMKIPSKKWAFFPESMVGEKAVNCSGAALIFGMIMNDELGIKTEHVNPWGHAANLVTYSDGSTQFVDSRNNVIHDLDLAEPREERDGFRIYKNSDRKLEYRLLPVSEFKHGAMLTMLENARELRKEQENDAEADMTVDDYGYGLDFDFADRYMESNFLIARENEEEWLGERDHIKDIRGRQDSFFLIPNH